MVMLLQQIVVLFALGFINFCTFSATAFVPIILTTNNNKYSMHNNMSDKSSSAETPNTTLPPAPCPHPFSELPGDPSLLLVTNVDLGDKKLDIMKKCSKAICEHTGKPEAYIGVSITDNASVLFGGSDDPCALGNIYSIGSIEMESNGKIHADVSNLLEEFGVKSDRMYINFLTCQEQMLDGREELLLDRIL